MLDKLIGSKLRTKLIGWLMMHPGESYFVRQLTAIIKGDSTNVSRELVRLEQMGIVTGRQDGRQKYYRANVDCPVFKELRGLVVKTVGLGDAVRAALKPVSGRTRVAFLFGSFARGEENAESDIDLLVVGDATPRDVAVSLAPVGRELGRELNTVVYTTAEFRKKAKGRHHFVVELLKGEKVFIIGDENELADLLS